MSSPSCIEILPSYIRIPNATLVSSFVGRDPRMECGVTVNLLATNNIHWLLIECPNRHSWDIPFPTANLGREHSAILVFQLPSNFRFDYYPVNLACRWSASYSSELRFSLVFGNDRDYRAMYNAASAFTTSAEFAQAVFLYGETNGALLVSQIPAHIGDSLFRLLEFGELTATIEEFY